MFATRMRLCVVCLVGLLALGMGAAAFGADDDISPAISGAQERVPSFAAKRLFDDELDQVSAGIMTVWQPNLSFTGVYLGGKPVVKSVQFGPESFFKVHVPPVKLKRFSFGGNFIQQLRIGHSFNGFNTTLK